MKEMIIKKVLIADDQSLFANGIKQLLEDDGDIQITAIIEKGDEVLDELNNNYADAILLDLNMPNKNGLEILEEIRDKFPNLIIAILSTYDERALIERAYKLGANAYLSKDATIPELREVIFKTHKLKFYLSEELTFTPRKNTIEDNFLQTTFITSREKEILKLVVKGKSSDKIANILHISPHTVRTHRRNLMQKLKLSNTTELIKFAYENKIV